LPVRRVVTLMLSATASNAWFRFTAFFVTLSLLQK
jgi:hypothetical protein